MATLAAAAVTASTSVPSLLSTTTSSSLQFPHHHSISLPNPKSSSSSSFTQLKNSNRNRFQIQPLCAAQDVAVVAEPEEVKVEDDEAASEVSGDVANNLKRKLYVVNLPWSLTVVDIKSLFGECGTVVDVEIIKQKNGKSKGYAFVTMENGDEAQAVVDKFDSMDVSGRIIRVQFAKAFKKKSPPPPAGAPLPGETRHKLYVSNLAWKARSTHLRDLFAEKFTPVSTKVVFENSTNRSAGYGFVSFATREEAETALSTFDGQELMGRRLRMRFSERTNDASNTEKETETVSQEASQES